MRSLYNNVSVDRPHGGAWGGGLLGLVGASPYPKEPGGAADLSLLQAVDRSESAWYATSPSCS